MCNNHTVVCLFIFHIYAKTLFILNVCYVFLNCVFRVVLAVRICTGHFVMVPLNLTYIVYNIFRFEHLFNLTFHYFELDTLVRG